MAHWSELRPHIRQVWRLSLPAILTQITTIVMQYIDAAMVGALGANASAAIGLMASSTWLMNGITYAVSAGFSVQVAHHIGAREEQKARTVVRHGLVCAAILSGFLCLLGALLSRVLPGWLGGDVSIQKDAGAYFLVFALALPAALCGIVGNWLGASLTVKKGVGFIRYMLLVVLVLLLAKMVIDVL